MHVRTRSLVSIAAGLSVLAAAAAAQPQRDLRPVAHVGVRPILASDLSERLAAERKQAAADSRFDAFGSKAAERTLQALIEVKLFAEAGRAAGLEARPAVQHEIENAIDEVLARTLLAERSAAVPQDEAALRRYYDAHASDFEIPGRVRARHIVVKTQAEATALLGRLRRNADFAELARANNIDTTRGTGGELGWVSRGVMVGPFDSALFSLKIGEISPVIPTTYGFHIVKVEAIEPGKPKPLASVAAEVRQKLLQAALDGWKAELRTKHTVKIDTAVLNSVR